MLWLAGILAILAEVANGDCGFPNGTDATFHWWQGPTTAKITFTETTPIDENGNPEYPIRLHAPLHVRVHFDNQQGELGDPNLLVSVKVFQYGGFISCDWSEIFTFGLLDNQNACKSGFFNCPVKVGEQDGTSILDFTQFGPIIGLLKDDAPYQLQITINDKRSGTYATLYSQARARTRDV